MGENLRKIMRYALCPVTTIIIATTTTTTRRYCQEISWFVQFYFLLIITIWMRGEIGLKCKRNHSLCSCHSHTSRLRMRWITLIVTNRILFVTIKVQTVWMLVWCLRDAVFPMQCFEFRYSIWRSPDSLRSCICRRYHLSPFVYSSQFYEQKIIHIFLSFHPHINIKIV